MQIMTTLVLYGVRARSVFFEVYILNSFRASYFTNLHETDRYTHTHTYT